MRQNTIHSLFEKNFALQCKKVNMSKCSGLRLALFRGYVSCRRKQPQFTGYSSFLKAQSKVLPHFGWLRPISFIFRFFLFLSRAYSTAACLTHHAECCRDAVREARDIKRGQLLAIRYFSCCTGWVKPPVAHYCHTLVTADLKYARNEPLTANKNYLATNRLLN